jgi:hypothetical protein
MMWERFDMGNSMQVVSFFEKLGERYRRTSMREVKSVVANQLSILVAGRQSPELHE